MPHREVLRKRAADLLEKKAKKMRENAIEKMGGVGKVFFIGEVVRVPVADVDKAKVDNSNVTGVIVGINAARMKGTVTCSCKGACDSNKCKCFKEARICSSACHRNNAKCKSHDRGDY